MSSSVTLGPPLFRAPSVRRVTAYLGLVAAALAPLWLLLERSSAVGAWSLAVNVAAGAATLVGVSLNYPASRRPWYLLAGALGCFAAASAASLVYAHRGLAQPFPSAVDGFRVAAYLLLVAALVLFVRRRTPARDWASMVDAGIVSLGAGALVWALVLEPAVRTTPGAGQAHAAAGALVAANICLIAVTVRLLLAEGLHTFLHRCLALATLLQVVVSSLLLAGVLHGHAELDGVLCLAVLPAHLLWGTLALLPEMRRLTERIDQPAPFLTRRRLVLVSASVLACTAVVLFQAFSRDGGAPGLAVLAAAMLGLVVARLAGLVAANERFVQREIALQAGAAALVAAQSREEIQRLGAATALELAGGQREAYAQLDLSTRVQSGLTDVFVVGDGEAACSLRAYVRQTGSLGRLGTARTLIVPVVIRERVHGVLRVTSPRPLPWHLRDGLSTLASQVALALEGAELTEDLLERRSEARFRSLVQNSNDLIAVLEPDLTIRYLTPSVEALLGYAPDDVVGRRLDEFLHLDELEAIGSRLRGDVEREGRPELEFRLRHRDDGWRTVEGVVNDLREDAAVGGLVLTAHDVSERRALEDQLTYQAFHDALTGLPNRALLTDRVTHALERALRSGTEVAVLFLDVDDFKTINDSLGHVAGDQLLVELARRLQGCLRGSDTAARLGGDEFAILLEETHGIEGAARAATRILDAVAPPFTLGDTELLAHASIGIVLGGADQTAGELLRNADVAMYRAKREGGSRYEVFRPEMHAAALTRLELKAELERAFNADELDLHYQQLVELDTGRVVGHEALLRWTHSARGSISPAEFVPLAEETGLINAIGHWALARACRETVAWQRTLPGGALVSANVNLSARQILQPGFHEQVSGALAESGLEPRQLVLEITESTLMEDVEGVSARLAELRALGVRIAIDDFGTGFSSLSYLQRFPVDELKIAKEFVDDVVGDPRKTRLVEAIVRLAGSLDLLTVAEGIETPEQRDRLREMGCTLGQGYLFSRPVPAGRVADLFAATQVAGGPPLPALDGS